MEAVHHQPTHHAVPAHARRHDERAATRSRVASHGAVGAHVGREDEERAHDATHGHAGAFAAAHIRCREGLKVHLLPNREKGRKRDKSTDASSPRPPDVRATSTSGRGSSPAMGGTSGGRAARGGARITDARLIPSQKADWSVSAVGWPCGQQTMEQQEPPCTAAATHHSEANDRRRREEARAPARDSGDGHTSPDTALGIGAGLDFSAGSRCPRPDGTDDTPTEALPPEVLDVIAVAAEIALQRRRASRAA